MVKGVIVPWPKDRGGGELRREVLKIPTGGGGRQVESGVWAWRPQSCHSGRDKSAISPWGPREEGLVLAAPQN